MYKELQEEMQQKKQQLEEIHASMKTLPISQKLAKIKESKALQKKIEELKKGTYFDKEDSALVGWGPPAIACSTWEALRASIEGYNIGTKATEHVIDALLEEVCNKWK